jgi:hypothetical protein
VAITSIEIDGDTAAAHMRGLSGPRDITLHRIKGRWFIRREILQGRNPHPRV